MPHYYFDIKDGHGLVDPSGLEFMDVRLARRTRVLVVHCIDHRRGARAVLARRNEQQRRALRVHKIDGIADTQRRLERDAAACRHDMAVVGAALFAVRQRIGERREKLLNDIEVMSLQPRHIRRTGSAAPIAVALGNTPRGGPASIAAPAAPKPRSRSIWTINPPKECPIGTGCSGKSRICFSK